MKLLLFQIDAFASQIFEGNPAAVVPLTEWLPDELMQRIAMENQLSETAFFFPEKVESESAVKALQPDLRKLTNQERRGLIVTAKGESADIVSRCFFPKFGIDEDPVTGSAHTTLAAYWCEKLGKDDFTARQISPRGGNL
ncbi:UNVERIFIED_CONTAM: hypothetical protein GTU68_029536, partial [Idotea baltica]|nr:hypothetical protein [Idotea baltica]